MCREARLASQVTRNLGSKEVIIKPTPSRRARTPGYQEYDLVPICEDIPQLDVRRGEEGVIENLDLRNNTVVALVKVYRSTRQLKGFVEMRLRPSEEVVSYSPVA
jgi:hypothetical protein